MAPALIDPKKLLAYRILTLSSLLNRGIEYTLEAEADLTVRQWRILLYLCTQGAGSIQQIADFCRYDKSQVSRAVSQLEERAMVQVVIQSSDRRSLRVSATVEGQIAYDKALPLSLGRQERLTSCLSEDDVQNLERLLEVLTHQAELLLQETQALRSRKMALA